MAVFHCHYGLRGEASALDFAFARDLAQAANCPFFSRVITEQERTARQGESIQEWARRLRREEFAKLAAQGWLIALAHHEDDLAENVLLRLARGASLGALAGMREVELPVWRPLLSVRKAALAAFMEREKIPHRHDASNDKLDYSRNLVRHRILPELEALFPGAAERIAASAREAQELAALSATLLGKARPDKDQALWLAGLPPAAARPALAQLIADGRGEKTLRPLSRRFLDEILTAARREAAAPPSLRKRHVRHIPGGGRLTVDGPQLLIEKAAPASKRQRPDQHARSLASPALTLQMEPGSHAFVSQARGSWVFSNTGSVVGSLSPVNVKVYGAGTRTALCFAGDQRPWTLKDLLMDWQVPAQERPGWAIVEIDGSTAALTDGKRLYRPAADGSQHECEPLHVAMEHVRIVEGAHLILPTRGS